jgi:hypothetical protein
MVLLFHAKCRLPALKREKQLKKPHFFSEMQASYDKASPESKQKINKFNLLKTKSQQM